MKRLAYWSKPFDATVLAESKWKQDVTHKPRGLWFSVGSDWQRWCLAENFSLDRLRHLHEVTLLASARLLTLRDPLDLDAFSERYGRAWPFTRQSGRGAANIDWRAVSYEYDAIEIAPYQWSRRFALSWYYGWDCASGCVWNAEAIESIRHVRDRRRFARTENVDA